MKCASTGGKKGRKSGPSSVFSEVTKCFDKIYLYANFRGSEVDPASRQVVSGCGSKQKKKKKRLFFPPL